ncbi:MAG: hypothetical protein J1F65_01975 [Clostridiales bacterium]|nr:hypothetical protein [Clostridiales bacterium]
MAEKDFFDEEFDKTVGEENPQQEEQPRKTDVDSWYSHSVPKQVDTKKNKPLFIVLTCFVLVACIGFGWLLCYLVNDLTTPEEEKILATVIDYLKNNYYKDVDNWTDAIEYSGTALMQYAGDRFSQLMSPETYYDFLYAESSARDKVFGVSFYIESGLGLYVSSVVANSSAYGRLQSGDFVLKLTNVKDDKGNPIEVGERTFSEINLSEWASTTIETMLDLTDSATFHVLRQDSSQASGYSLLSYDLQKGAIESVGSNQYAFIEYYFGDGNTNISIEPMGGAKISTKQERYLDLLPDDTGYVRITQFMDYVLRDGNGNIMTDKDGKVLRVTASSEFKSVMDEFRLLGKKRLVLDLKGNPGGNVSYVSEIGGMLVTTVGDKLTDAQKKSVTNSKNELLMTYLDMPKPAHVVEYHYQESSYFQYFNAMGSTCDIVVWTDGGSASGSEMLTGILREYGTAVHMGTKTYGKGIAQTYQELPFTQTLVVNGEKIVMPWAIYYTCAKYYSPLGVNIHGEGYTPDAPYNGLSDYESLWNAAKIYWALN